MENRSEFKDNHDERIAQPMAVAADNLVHFYDGTLGLLRGTADDDGLTAVEVAGLVRLCLADAAC